MTTTQQDALIDAAEERAKLYDGDDRECIKADVMNAFFAGAQFNQAAANKAAEEGGLPFAELSINQKRALSEGLSALEAMADIWSAEIRLSEMAKRIADAPAEQRPGTIAAMIEQAFIEGAYRHFLDHKDEANQYKIDAERYRWLQREAERDYAQFTVDSHKDIICECKEALDETIDAAMYEVTPPATTGASTVLTDERIEQVWSELSLTGAYTMAEARALFARAIEREVAAQAGQVAVTDLHDAIMRLPCNHLAADLLPSPADREIRAYQIGHRDARHAAAELVAGAEAGQVAVPVISSYDLQKVRAAKTNFVDALIHSGVQYRTCGAISATLNEIIDHSEAAAQSPAKESLEPNQVQTIAERLKNTAGLPGESK